MWILYAVLSAFFGSLMVIFMKVGLKDIDPNLGLFIRTIFVFVFSLGLITITGKIKDIRMFNGKIWGYILLASIVTFLTWTFYFLALKNGKSNNVMAIDKCGVIITVLINVLFFHEKLTIGLVLGMFFFLLGTVFILTSN